MLTEKDIDELEERLRDVFATKEEFQKYRSDIMDKLDVILKEVVASREERVVVDHKLSKHEDRITSLEKTVATS